MIWIAIILFLVPLVHHLGFIDKAYIIAGEIAKCPMCCTFWIGLMVLMLKDCDILIAISLSFIAAYLSNYANILIIILDKFYKKLWEKVNQRKHSKK